MSKSQPNKPGQLKAQPKKSSRSGLQANRLVKGPGVPTAKTWAVGPVEPTPIYDEVRREFAR